MHIPSAITIEDKENNCFSIKHQKPYTRRFWARKVTTKKSTISEVNNFLKRRSWIINPKYREFESGRNPVEVKWVFKKINEPGGSIRYTPIVVTLGYMQISRIYYKELILSISIETLIIIDIGLKLCFDSENWIFELVDAKTAFLEGK